MTTVDFDAYRAEQTHEPFRLKLGGKEYELPPSLPAALALDIVKLQATKGPGADFTPQDVQRLGSALFGGEEKFNTILSEGAVTIEEMPELVKRVLLAYGGGTPPNRKARRARARTTTSSS